MTGVGVGLYPRSCSLRICGQAGPARRRPCPSVPFLSSPGLAYVTRTCVFGPARNPPLAKAIRGWTVPAVTPRPRGVGPRKKHVAAGHPRALDLEAKRRPRSQHGGSRATSRPRRYQEILTTKANINKSLGSSPGGKSPRKPSISADFGSRSSCFTQVTSGLAGTRMADGFRLADDRRLTFVHRITDVHWLAFVHRLTDVLRLTDGLRRAGSATRHCVEVGVGQFNQELAHGNLQKVGPKLPGSGSKY